MQEAATILGRFVTYIINPAILVVFAAGFFMFMWGLVQFVLGLDEGGKREDGVRHMLWGIIGMVIMVSVYGILALLDNTFNLGALSGQGFDTSGLNNLSAPGGGFK
ncbi:MAG: hypothetical protein HYS26_03880 [Candidatus Kaiserbacteria bacterium]|nr:MAG: hypothetical protein HYS26_03880 [Candidatus Kaiserbacteria bacterium]